jgi:hypothetical protein
MATRLLDSGRVQVRSVGGSPGQPAQARGVNYVGFQAQANAAGTLAKSLDSMSNYAFKMAAEQRSTEAQQDYMANYQITDDVLQKAKNGDMSVMQDVEIGNKFSVYGKTLRKMRSFELSNRFEQEIRNLAGQVKTDAEENGLGSEDAHYKLQSAIQGYSQVIGGMDADAALKFQNASMVHASVAVNAAYKEEAKRNKDISKVMIDQEMEFYDKRVREAITDGQWVDGAGKIRNPQELIELYRDGMRKGSFFAGGAEYAKTKIAEFDKMVLDNTKQVAAEYVRTSNDPLKTYETMRRGFTGNLAIDSVLKGENRLEVLLVAKNEANDFAALEALNETNDKRTSNDLKAEYADHLSSSNVSGMRSVLSRLRVVDGPAYAKLLEETDNFAIGVNVFSKRDSQIVVDDLDKKFSNPYGVGVTFQQVFDMRKNLTKDTYQKYIEKVKTFGDEQIKLMQKQLAAKLKIAPGMIIPDAARKRNESIQNEVIDAFIVERRSNPNLDAGLWLETNFEKYKKIATRNHNSTNAALVAGRTLKTVEAFDAALKQAQAKPNATAEQNRLTREKNELIEAIKNGDIDKNGNLIKKDGE